MSFNLWLRSVKDCFGAASTKRNNRHARRTKARQFSLVLETLEDRLAPATLIVNTNADVVNPTNGTLSLRDAISTVNAGNTNGLTSGEKGQVSGTFGTNDTIEFSSTLSGDTITLNGSVLPAITKSMTIAGLGVSSLAISGNSQSQVFLIDAGTTVAISGLTIQDGFGGQSTGGGINNAGTLTVSNSTLSAIVVGSTFATKSFPSVS